MTNALHIYQWITKLGGPIIYIYIKFRQLKGKEDPARISERFGYASKERPKGTLWWLHAASVGEAMSLRPLLEQIRAQAPEIHLLLTSGTVSSANMLAQTLPDNMVHQFVPVDTPQACKRFMEYWQPEVGVFTESELWPNLLVHAKQQGVKLALINARMSEKSLYHWRLLPDMAASLLSTFSLIAAQADEDAKRFKQLGARQIKQLGHLKHDADELPVDKGELNRWQDTIKGRICLVAASFHPGEDELLAHLHQSLKAEFPNLLTILVPRHPPRAAGMVQSFKALDLYAMQRSRHAVLPTDDVDCYIADTIGELGLWYRLADVVIMGGSFIAHGGQNPLEAIRLDKPVVIGPHVHNFQTMVEELQAAKGIIQLETIEVDELLPVVQELLADHDHRTELVNHANRWLEHTPPVAARLTQALLALSDSNSEEI